MSNGFQLLCSTTTVWIIDTLFQLVSSGIKIFFISQVMNYLLPLLPPGCEFMRLNGGKGHPVSLLRQKTTGYANTAIGYGLNYTRWQQLFCICLLLLTPLLAGFFFLCW